MNLTDAAAKTTRINGIEAIRALIRPDMARVNALIESSLYSEVGLIDQLGHYIIESGGKRLRPALGAAQRPGI